MTAQPEARPKCSKCGSATGYVRFRTKEFVCKRCGAVTPQIQIGSKVKGTNQ